MDERVRIAFEFAAALAEQLITLATGILVLSVTFLKDVAASRDTGRRWLLIVAWSLYFFSILAGIWALMALTGSLDPVGATGVAIEVTRIGGNVRFPAKLQVVSFLLATICFTSYGVIMLKR